MAVTKGTIHTYGGQAVKAADASFDISASFSVGTNRILLLFMNVVDVDAAIMEDFTVTADIAGDIGKRFFTDQFTERLGVLAAAIAVPDEQTENITFTLLPNCDDPTGKTLRVNYNTITLIGARAEDAALTTNYGEAFQSLSFDPLSFTVDASTTNDMLVAIGAARAHDTYVDLINGEAPSTTLEVEGFELDFPNAVLSFQAPVVDGAAGAVEYSNGASQPEDLWAHSLFAFLFRAVSGGGGGGGGGGDGSGINCECDDPEPQKSLAALRRDLLIRAGFAAVASNPPPGTAELFDAFLRDAQVFLYRKYPALRTRRYFRWTMEEGIRYYGLRENDEGDTRAEVTITVASPGVVNWPGTPPAVGRRVSFVPAPDGFLPFPLEPGTQYYVVEVGSGTTQIALIPGGTPINVTGAGSGVITAFGGPDSSCIFNMDPYKNIEGAWLVDLNGQWIPLICGIPAVLYTTVGNEALPQRYEIRQCIEVFPAPPADGYQLMIKGHFGLRPFELDSDRLTIDGHLVYLWALANALDYYGKPSAAGIATQAKDYLGELAAGTHTGKRYVPGARQLPPAIMPVYAPWPGEY